jgi:ATP-dependent helicase/nuclease subunit A
MLYDLIDRIFRIAENWLKVYSDYKRSKSIIDYNDMEQYFLTLLENNDIAEDIRGRYKYVFVDEFQDCNPVQVKIFDKLSEYVEGSYWVGDGKQAIYGFRGTDTCLTASVAEIISDNKSHFKTLSNSYRSLPDIVNVVNEFFTRVFVNRLNMMKEENVVLKATKKDESNTQQLTLLNTNAKNKDNFGMAIAKKIACLINEEGKSPETIAVLGRNKSDFTSVVNYLHAQGIPVNSESSDKLEEQEETTLLTSILSLIIDGHDELAKAQIAFLTTPDTSIENIIDSRLDYLAEQNDNEWLHDNDMIRKVEEQRKDLSVLSVAAMVESAIMRLDLFSVVTRWGDSEKRKSNLENIIALAHQYEERCVTMTLGASVTGFISYINNAQATSTGDSKGVFVNTYHKSKGLEWDTVILISLDKKPSDEDAFIKRGFLGVNLVNTETPNKDNLYPLKYINMMPNIFTNNNAKMPDDINESIKAMDSYSSSLENNIREEARLMYVGMTRAKEQLILACKSRDSLSWLNDISGSDLKMPANNGRADVLQTGIQFNVEVMESSDDDETNEEEYTCKVVSLPENEDIITEELRYQSPSVMTKTSTDVSIKHDFGKRINLNGEKNMQVVGDCIHNIFCVLRQGDENNNINKAEKLIVAYLLQEKIHATEVTSAYTSFLTEMKQLYGEATNVYHELEFSYPQNGCIVRGSMDFVYETPQGCVLVDFKSNPEGKTAVTNKENELYAGNYNTQFTCYASALKKQGKKVIEKLVYYPVSGLLLKLK